MNEGQGEFGLNEAESACEKANLVQDIQRHCKEHTQITVGYPGSWKRSSPWSEDSHSQIIDN